MANKKKIIGTDQLEQFDGVQTASGDLTRLTEPLMVKFTITGKNKLLFHAWNQETVKQKTDGVRGGKVKKTDDIQSYVYRNEDGDICIPSIYVHSAMRDAGKSFTDPRSTRASCMGLVKQALIPQHELATLGVDKWDYLAQHRAVVNRASINRVRPGFMPGWQATFTMMSVLPEYMDMQLMYDILATAGNTIGIGDYRPMHGRFVITSFERVAYEETFHYHIAPRPQREEHSVGSARVA